MEAGIGYMKFATISLIVILHVVIGMAVASCFTPISDLILSIIIGAVFMLAYPCLIVAIYWGVKEKMFD